MLVITACTMQLAKVLRFLKIMKMLKLLRLPRIFSTLRAVVGKAFISMVMLTFGILMVCLSPTCVLNGCGVHLTADPVSQGDFRSQVTHLAATLFYFIASEYVRPFAILWALFHLNFGIETPQPILGLLA